MATANYQENRFLDGHYLFTFGSVPTEASVAHCVSAADMSGAAFYLEKFTFNCMSGTSATIHDGSTGRRLFGTYACPSNASTCVSYDFDDDPLICLTADSTDGICVSAGAGGYSGIIKGYWGPKGS